MGYPRWFCGRTTQPPGMLSLVGPSGYDVTDTIVRDQVARLLGQPGTPSFGAKGEGRWHK